MRVAAGVCLILAAVLNLFASLGYLGGGAATTGISHLSTIAMEEAAKESGTPLTEADRESMEVATGVGKGIGGLLMALGLFLLVSVGILIAGAVFLFQGTNWKFILASGVVAIAAELCGILLTTFGLSNVMGLVGGVLAIIVAVGMNKSAAPVVV